LLTGLPNRVLYLDRLQQQIRLARRDRRELAVLFLDLDEFKPINDRYGHDVGDQVLREVAERLSECVRSADTVARIGGDEFTIVVGPLDTAGDATIVARKILESVARPFLVDRHSHQIGVSIGIALYPQDASDAEGLTRRADAAMYVAKSCGRNTVRYYEPDRADGSEERFTDGTEAGAGDAVEPH
ncbi:MAG TPA: GGDEF domain-containing protein, partial [Gammaproteobacteria bacterium]